MSTREIKGTVRTRSRRQKGPGAQPASVVYRGRALSPIPWLPIFLSKRYATYRHTHEMYMMLVIHCTFPSHRTSWLRGLSRHMQSIAHASLHSGKDGEGWTQRHREQGRRRMSTLEQKAKGVILQKLSIMQNAWTILLNQIF